MSEFEEKILNPLNGNVLENIHAIRDEAVASKVCPLCNRPADHVPFTDEISKQESKITGFCQPCQDKVFVEPED